MGMTMNAGRFRTTLIALIAALASVTLIATAQAATPKATFAMVGDETAIP